MQNNKQDESFLQAYPAEVQRLTALGRSRLRLLYPDLHERVYTGYKTIGYAAGEKMNTQAFYLAPHLDHLNLGFPLGTRLPDPDHLLEGTGKMMRHVKIRQENDLEQPALHALLEAAYQAIKV